MPGQPVQTKRMIAALLADVSARPKKRFGQHFLIDGNLMRRLCDSAELDRGDVVLEVGGGTGGLTDLLAGRTGPAGRVICVEIDGALFAVLEDRFRDAPGVTLIRDDVLAGKHRLCPAVDAALRQAAADNVGGTVKLVANLPYQVATPLMMNLLVDYPQVSRLCFTVQAELADRIVARPACRAYGPVSILAQLMCDVRVVARLPPSVFWPRPAVDSVMLRLDVKDLPFAQRDGLRGFVRFVRATFDHRRKTLRSALAHAVDETTRQRICDVVDASRRPESFEIAEWLEMYRNAGAGG
ncbi:MAG: 16S rRNA (adenine(1518)-N(6)/adenine(1519)-N(6))-dimethyltransferase RsmA [Phycisphaerae bacterium]